MSKRSSNIASTLRKGLRILSKNGSFFALILMIVVAAIIYPEFGTVRNFTNVFRQMSMVGLCAVGMTFVIISGGIDLSIGATIALAGILAAKLSATGAFLSILIPLLAGLCVGGVNAFVVTKLRVVPFIATLAVQMLMRGISYVMTNMRSVSVTDESGVFTFLGRGYIASIPFPVIIFVIIAVIAVVLTRRTSYGRSVYAIGGNESAADMMGIQVKRSKSVSYIMTGILSALAGVILCSRLGAGQPVSGQGWEMDAIAAVAIGGTLLSGGVGGIGKTICGVLIIGFIKNIINLQGNINSYWQNIIMGAIILLVIIVQSKGKRSRESE